MKTFKQLLYFPFTRYKFRLVLWSADLLGAWRDEKNNPYLHTLMRESEKHKQFCFSVVLFIYTILTDAFLSGKVWFLFELQIPKGTKKDYY